MISASTICSSFKKELLEGIHNFLTDQFYLALYTSASDLSADSTVYTVADEVEGIGYVAGGMLLVNPQVLMDPAARIGFATFDDPVWDNSVITARGALIYNQSAQQRAVAVVNFGVDYTSNHGPFHVQLPPPGANTALIRIY
jgi:hypothetical protein